MTRPRVLVLASTYPRWTADPEPGFVHELARRLVPEFDVTVLTPHAAGAPERESMDGVHVRRFRYAPAALETLVHEGGMAGNLRRARWKWLLVAPFLISYVVSAARLLRRERFHVLHVHWLIPQGVVALAARLLAGSRVPFLVTSHGADLFAFAGGMARRVKSAVARRAAAITVVSEAMRHEFERQALDVRIPSIEPMGVDLRGRFTPASTDGREPDLLLFVGRLVEKKGLASLLRAFPSILAVRPQTRLAVIGFGPEAESCERLAEALGIAHRVRFLGAVPNADLAAWYRRATVLAAPFQKARSGDEEGLGLVAVEAAGCGCRLVLGDVVAVRGAFDGLAGVELADAADPAALADACLRALEGGPAPLSLREHMLEHFDWTSRAAAYAARLRALAAT